MNLRQLQTFVCVAEAGGFSRALARLHLSQPAASRQILALEAELNLALFDRIGRGLRLTSAGEDLLRQSREFLSQADVLRQRARALQRGDAGVLRVGATPQTIANSLAEFVQTYRRNLPDVDVQLVEDGGARLPNRLVHGDIDLAIMPVGDDRFAGRLLYPMHTFAVMPIRHRWSRLPVLDVAQLANERILVGAGFASTALFKAACEVAHVKPKIVLESSAPDTLITLVRTEFGIAVLPSAAMSALHGVRAVPLVYRGASIGRWVHVAWNPERFLAPYATRFARELAERSKKYFPASDLIRRAPALTKPKHAESA
jgi:DNA-binding transcriptional LysR family regulator